MNVKKEKWTKDMKSFLLLFYWRKTSLFDGVRRGSNLPIHWKKLQSAPDDAPRSSKGLFEPRNEPSCDFTFKAGLDVICSSSCALNFDDFRFFSSSIAHLEPDLEQFENRLIFPAAIMFQDSSQSIYTLHDRLVLTLNRDSACRKQNWGSWHFSIWRRRRIT